MFLLYADTFVSLVSGTKINFKTTEKTSKILGQEQETNKGLIN